METVSVIIPTYKRHQKLQRAVESVLAQTFKPTEIIVINDDPQTDINTVIPQDERIRTIAHDTNMGAPASRNDGIETSTGQYIALLDDDDEWREEKLERQLARFAELDDDYGMVYTGQEIIRNGETVLITHPQIEGEIFSQLLQSNFIPSQSPLIRRECFNNVGFFDTSLESSQDYDMWLRIAKDYKIASIPEPLTVAYHGHDGRISDNPKKKYFGEKQFLAKYEGELNEHPAALHQQYKQLGIYAAYLGKYGESKQYFQRAFIQDPTDYVTAFYLIMSLLPSTLANIGFLIQRRIAKW